VTTDQIDIELASALIEGAFEQPQWGTFLERLRNLAGADHATLSFRPPGRPFDDMIILVSGSHEPFDLDKIYRDNFDPIPPPFIEEMEEGRVYGREEWLAALDPAVRAISQRILVDADIQGFRELHVREPSGIHAWLSITSWKGEFGPQAEQLLARVSSLMRGTLRNYIALERERYKTAVTADATRRLKFGWLALDRNGTVVDYDEQGAAILESSSHIGRTRLGRLTAKTSVLEQRIHAAVEAIAGDPLARATAITVSQDPWLDMLLLKAEGRSISVAGKAEVIAYVHGDSWRADDRSAQLAELFGLSPREAGLALAFCRGMTIAEAAEEFGLSIDTTRNYSKAIYGKIGARGMADLIRLIMRSILAFSPK